MCRGVLQLHYLADARALRARTKKGSFEKKVDLSGEGRLRSEYPYPNGGRGRKSFYISSRERLTICLACKSKRDEAERGEWCLASLRSSYAPTRQHCSRVVSVGLLVRYLERQACRCDDGLRRAHFSK